MATATVSDLARARRILICGVTGSGKSTAAVQLGQLLSLPAVLADDHILWLPGWVGRDPSEQRRIAQDLARTDSWVFDSASSAWVDVVLDRVEVVVALDYARWISLTRLLRRTVTRIARRTPVCNGNVESLRQALSRDSIIAWHFRSFAKRRRRIAEWEASPQGPRVLRLQTPRELEELLGSLGP